MAGKGGGSWKVAYADFVTAMMAFFLVMWLCSQNQNVKKAVAEYFNPIGAVPGGTSRKPNRSGSPYESINAGAVPEEQGVALARGRQSHSPPYIFSKPTKVVADWIHNEKQIHDYWKQQAKDQREAARYSKAVQENKSTIHRTAVSALAAQIREELVREMPGKSDSVHRSMLHEIMSQVNWEEIAEDLLTE